MSGQAAIFILLGACAGGFVNGLAGTGTALFALGFFLVALDPVSAVAVVSLMSVVTGLQGLWEVRSALKVDVPRLARFTVPGLVGVPVGISLLGAIDADMLKLLVAALLILYGGFFSFRADLPKFERRTPLLDSAIGLVSGVLGGMASLSGALPTIWCSMRPWPKRETRAVLQPFNVTVLSATTAMLWWRGAYDGPTITAFLIALPAAMLAAQIGLLVFRRLRDDTFRRLLIGLALFLGVGIALRAAV
ncbi:sulfite exporter TauE/SafE family protein [Marivita sp. GX14005]|uniref:sulfite exporter TauE/SafE family protein n=1 Tax=Marivita sp. GX14005 TaxID=2942276 RepID=UPI002019B3F9|nr:sulfite exporter TauE/SafE family protein [Marivita sp. GX14005]MCL3882963.1 sulfite exporter TauE/SafE family protein [Marivita sp. GX14005]